MEQVTHFKASYESQFVETNYLQQPSQFGLKRPEHLYSCSLESYIIDTIPVFLSSLQRMSTVSVLD